MAVTVKAILTRDFTSTTNSWSATTVGTLPTSAEKLVVLLTTRAYTAGGTRTMGVEWRGVTPVPVAQTSLLGTITGQDDFHYWVGVLASPSLASQLLEVTADANLRGLHATLIFVDGADDTAPIIVHDFQDRDTLGNSVTLNGTPARAGSVIVSANGIGTSTTGSSFAPSAWTTAVDGPKTGGGNQTIAVRYAQAASTAAVETVAQWAASDINRGGVLFEIQAATGTLGALTESASPSDSVGTPVVTVSLGLTETASAADSTTALIPSNTTPENPVGVWTGAAASWKLPEGTDSKGNNNLTASGLSAATIKGPGAAFTATSYARRTAPALGTPTAFTTEFWVKPTASGRVLYIGPTTDGGGPTATEMPATWPTRTVYAAAAATGTGTGADPSNRRSLANALTAAVAGDYINLANGNYTGDYTLAAGRDGTASSPIVIGASGAVGGGTCDLTNIGLPRFTGNFTLSGDHGWLWGLYFDGQLSTAPGRVLMDGSYTRLQRCKIARWRTTAAAGAGYNYCNILGPGTNQAVYFCEVDDYDGVPFLTENQGSTKGDGIHWFRCYLHDNVPEATGSTGNARETIGLGRTQVGSTPAGQRVNNALNCRVVECLFKNLYNPGGSFDESEIISNKGSDNYIIRNSFDNCAKFMTIRFGNNCRVIGNRHDAGGIIIYGDNHRVISNVAPVIRIYSGTQTMDTGTTQVHPNGPTNPDSGNINAFTPWGGSAAPDNSDEPCCRNPFISGNNSTLNLGAMPRDYARLRVIGAIVEQHTGTINTERTYTTWGGRAHTAQGGTWPGGYREYGSIYRATATVTLPGTPAMLTASEVGPTAPWITPVRE